MGGFTAPKHEAPDCTGITLRVKLCALTPQVPHSYARAGAGDRASPRAPSTLYPIRDMLVLQDMRHHIPVPPARPRWARAALAAPGLWREDPPPACTV